MRFFWKMQSVMNAATDYFELHKASIFVLDSFNLKIKVQIFKSMLKLVI